MHMLPLCTVTLKKESKHSSLSWHLLKSMKIYSYRFQDTIQQGTSMHHSAEMGVTEHAYLLVAAYEHNIPHGCMLRHWELFIAFSSFMAFIDDTWELIQLFQDIIFYDMTDSIFKLYWFVRRLMQSYVVLAQHELHAGLKLTGCMENKLPNLEIFLRIYIII